MWSVTSLRAGCPGCRRPGAGFRSGGGGRGRRHSCRREKPCVRRPVFAGRRETGFPQAYCCSGATMALYLHKRKMVGASINAAAKNSVPPDLIGRVVRPAARPARRSSGGGGGGGGGAGTPAAPPRARP